MCRVYLREDRAVRVKKRIPRLTEFNRTLIAGSRSQSRIARVLDERARSALHGVRYQLG
jgi:hypothetical protein